MIWLLVDSSTVGGIERHVATLAHALRRRGLAARIVLLARHGDNPWFRQLAALGLDYVCLDGTVSGLRALLSKDRPNIVHTHGYKAGILGRLAAGMAGIASVSTFHSGERGVFPVNVYQAADAWTSFLSTRLAVSEPIRQALPYPATLVKNFMVLEHECPTTAWPMRVGFVGRLSHEKGPDRFCRLAAESGMANVEWHIWGDGPMRRDLEAEYGAHVKFHGLVTNLEQVWPTVGLLVMPSRAEGLPMAALEAFAAGVPIMATAVGALPQMIKPGVTGWLFDADKQPDAAACLATWQALTERDQLAMRRACYSFVEAEYSDTTQLEPILDAYARAGFNALTQLRTKEPSSHPADLDQSLARPNPLQT